MKEIIFIISAWGVLFGPNCCILLRKVGPFISKISIFLTSSMNLEIIQKCFELIQMSLFSHLVISGYKWAGVILGKIYFMLNNLC